MRSRRRLKVSHTQTSVPCGTLKYREKSPKWGLYGPQRQFSPQLKVLIFGTCTKNILMCSQVKFEADKPHSL